MFSLIQLSAYLKRNLASHISDTISRQNSYSFVIGRMW